MLRENFATKYVFMEKIVADHYVKCGSKIQLGD